MSCIVHDFETFEKVKNTILDRVFNDYQNPQQIEHLYPQSVKDKMFFNHSHRDAITEWLNKVYQLNQQAYCVRYRLTPLDHCNQVRPITEETQEFIFELSPFNWVNTDEILSNVELFKYLQSIIYQCYDYEDGERTLNRKQAAETMAELEKFTADFAAYTIKSDLAEQYEAAEWM